MFYDDVGSGFARRHRPLVYFALLAYGFVMLVVTILKRYLSIGSLWRPNEVHIRTLELVPFDDFFQDKWIGGIAIDTIGNVALFVPFGILVYILLVRQSAAVRRTVLMGCAASLSIEVAQYIFALGYTDVDDLILNTVGALLGALLARAFGPRLFGVWTGLTLVTCIVFIAATVALQASSSAGAM